MNKISSNLEHEMKFHPEKVFHVIITLKKGCHPQDLKLFGYKVLMDTIITASLNINQLLSLSKSDEVIAIEDDLEMGIL